MSDKKDNDPLFSFLDVFYKSYVNDGLLDKAMATVIAEISNALEEGIDKFLPSAGIACISREDLGTIDRYGVEMENYPESDEDLLSAFLACAEEAVSKNGFPIFVITALESWYLETDEKSIDNLKELDSISEDPNAKECILVQIATFSGKIRSKKISLGRDEDNNLVFDEESDAGDKPSRNTIAMLMALQHTLEENIKNSGE